MYVRMYDAMHETRGCHTSPPIGSKAAVDIGVAGLEVGQEGLRGDPDDGPQVVVVVFTDQEVVQEGEAGTLGGGGRGRWGEGGVCVCVCV